MASRNRHRSEMVGAHVVGDALRAAPSETVAGIRERLLAEKPACVELVLVVGGDHRLAGVMPLEKLFAVDDTTELSAGCAPSDCEPSGEIKNRPGREEEEVGRSGVGNTAPAKRRRR